MAQGLRARFVYISTDAVFDGRHGNYSETDRPDPLSAYAKSKLRGGREVLRRHSSALIVRVSIYGWNQQSMAEWVLNEILAGSRVPGFADFYFCPILADDLAEVLLTMPDLDLSGIYHVGSSQRIGKYDFARRAAMTFNLAVDRVAPVSLAAANLRAPRPMDPSLNTDKIRAALGRPMPDVETDLGKFRHLRDSGYRNQLKSFLIRAS